MREGPYAVLPKKEISDPPQILEIKTSLTALLLSLEVMIAPPCFSLYFIIHAPFCAFSIIFLGCYLRSSCTCSDISL